MHTIVAARKAGVLKVQPNILDAAGCRESPLGELASSSHPEYIPDGKESET
jgi:hypothetical protein